MVVEIDTKPRSSARTGIHYEADPIGAPMTSRTILESTTAGKTIKVVGREIGEPELFVDGIHGVMRDGLAMKLNFFTRGFSEGDKSDEERREVACRMVMTLDTFLSVADFLKVQAERLREEQQILEVPEDVVEAVTQNARRKRRDRKKPRAKPKSPSKKK